MSLGGATQTQLSSVSPEPMILREKMSFTRRQMMLGLLGFGTSKIFSGCKMMKQIGYGPSSAFDPARSMTLSAAADRILPGAADAGAADYINFWMKQDPFAKAMDWKPLLNIGAIHLNRVAERNHKKPFHLCRADEQDAILKRFQQGGIAAKGFRSELFFQRLVMLTLESFFSDPKYGGNRKLIGWHFIGKKPCWWAPTGERL